MKISIGFSRLLGLALLLGGIMICQPGFADSTPANPATTATPPAPSVAATQAIDSAVKAAIKGPAPVDPADVNAASVKEELGKCVALKDTILRLECYDAYAGGFGVVSSGVLAQKDTVLTKTGLWTMSHKADSLGVENTYARLPMNESLRLPSGAKIYPELVISCKRNDTDVYIDWKDQLVVPRVAMSYRFDDGPVLNEVWTVADDGEALFSPNAVQFAQLAYGKKLLAMSFPPTRNDGEVSLDFNLTGIESALNVLAQQCYK